MALDQFFDGLNYIDDFLRLQFDPNWNNLTRVEFNSGAYSLEIIQLEMKAVPVPAAIWLYGSDLIALIRFQKRNSGLV